MSETHAQGPSPEDAIDQPVNAAADSLQFTESPAQMTLPGMDAIFCTHVEVVTGAVEEFRAEVADDPLMALPNEATEPASREVDSAPERQIKGQTKVSRGK